MISPTDGGHAFSHPIQIISSYLPKEVLGPFVSFAPTGSQGDHPEIRVDSSTGKIYLDGKSVASDPPHRQTVVRMLDDNGVSWQMVYAFDSADWPQAGASGYDVANGMLGVAYTASAVPASLNTKCPCRVFGVSSDEGKTFERHLIPAPFLSSARGPFAGGMTVLGNPAKKGMFTVLIPSPDAVQSYIIEDAGKNWTETASLAGVPNTTLETDRAFGPAIGHNFARLSTPLSCPGTSIHHLTTHQLPLSSMWPVCPVRRDIDFPFRFTGVAAEKVLGEKASCKPQNVRCGKSVSFSASSWPVLSFPNMSQWVRPNQ